jgi:PAT family beta-lactamase induction signal transducer AmpG
LLVAFLSASQDVVVDAYRTDVLEPRERGLGGSLYVFGYRLAMIVSGGVALIWADQWQSWPRVYMTMAGIMVAAAAVSLTLLPSVSSESKPLASEPRKELAGFAAMLAGFVAGWFAARWLLIGIGLDPDNPDKWLRLLFILAQVAGALPLGWWAARKVGFETLNRSLASYFAQPGAAAFLLLIILYKLGDAFAGTLTTPFLIKGMLFTQAEVGIVNKIIGVWLTILGALLGGAIMLRLNLYRSLLLFGVLQLVAIFGFWLLAVSGKGAWGGFMLPPFDLGFVALPHSTWIDGLLVFAIAAENITSGMGTAAFVALLMGLCNHRYTATHYALLSAFSAVGRIYVSPLAGVLSESIGWPAFFLLAMAFGLPGLWMVWRLREPIRRLNGGL